MGLLDYFRSSRGSSNSAKLAKERLQIIVARESGDRQKSPDFLPRMKRELLEVVRRYVDIEQDQVKAHVERDGNYEILELNITLPEKSKQSQ